MHPYMGGLILFVTLTSCGANQQRKINGWHMHPLHSYEAHQQLKISVWNVQCALHAECIIDELIIGILGSSIFRLVSIVGHFCSSQVHRICGRYG